MKSSDYSLEKWLQQQITCAPRGKIITKTYFSEFSLAYEGLYEFIKLLFHSSTENCVNSMFVSHTRKNVSRYVRRLIFKRGKCRLLPRNNTAQTQFSLSSYIRQSRFCKSALQLHTYNEKTATACNIGCSVEYIKRRYTDTVAFLLRKLELINYVDIILIATSALLNIFDRCNELCSSRLTHYEQHMHNILATRN